MKLSNSLSVNGFQMSVILTKQLDLNQHIKEYKPYCVSFTFFQTSKKVWFLFIISISGIRASVMFIWFHEMLPGAQINKILFSSLRVSSVILHRFKHQAKFQQLMKIHSVTFIDMLKKTNRSIYVITKSAAKFFHKIPHE